MNKPGYIIVGSYCDFVHDKIKGKIRSDMSFPALYSNKDIDVWTTKEKYDLTVNRLSFAYPNDTHDIKIIPNHIFNIVALYTIEYFDEIFLDVIAKYILRLSHLQWDINWKKHARKVIEQQKELSDHQKASIKYSHYNNLYTVLFSYWNKIHKDLKPNINLNTDAERFFNSNVKRMYDHDDLHRMVAHYDVPMHTKIKKDNKSVLCCPKKFDALSIIEKDTLCREEIFVIALERYIIPSRLQNNQMNPKMAYREALYKLVTRMSKGWFPRYILENLDRLGTPYINYVELFDERRKNYETIK